MTTADVAVLLAAAAIAAVALTVAALSRRQTRRARAECDTAVRLLAIAEGTVTAISADADRAAQRSTEALADLDTRLTRITAERDQAQRRGEKAAIAAMVSKAKDREEFVESLQAWQYLTFAALQLPGPRALTAAPSPPELLRSGHTFVAGDPDVLIHPDDLDVMSLPLPRRTT